MPFWALKERSQVASVLEESFFRAATGFLEGKELEEARVY